MDITAAILSVLLALVSLAAGAPKAPLRATSPPDCSRTWG